MKRNIFTSVKTLEPLHVMQARLLTRLKEDFEKPDFFQKWKGTAEEYQACVSRFASKDVKRWEMATVEKILDANKKPQQDRQG